MSIKDQIYDISEEEIAEENLQKRHDELVATLKDTIISQREENDKLITSLNEITVKFDAILKVLPDLKSQGNESLVYEIQSLGEKLKQEDSPEEWNFEVSRDYAGYIKTIKAIQK